MRSTGTDRWANDRTSEPPGEQARGRTGGKRKRFFIDPRFAVGLILIAASVAGVGAIVSGADRSIAVYAARGPLAVGDRIDESDLVSTRVRFASASDLYLTPGRLPEEGLLVTRTISAGELVATSAVGTRAGEEVTSVVVDVQGTLAGAIVPGAVVDVWAAREGDQAKYGAPVVLVGNASVVRLIETRSLIADGRGQSVEVLVPKTKVAAVLESLANEDAIALVPVNADLAD